MTVSKLSFLNRVESLIKDFCGSVSEDSIRNNFILIYEIIDELLDFGYFQSETSEEILPYIQQ
jgi:AP-4 complex subunit mu-1